WRTFAERRPGILASRSDDSRLPPVDGSGPVSTSVILPNPATVPSMTVACPLKLFASAWPGISAPSKRNVRKSFFICCSPPGQKTSMPAPVVSAGGISLSKKGLCLRGKEGGTRNQVMGDRVCEELEACLHTESPVQLRQMRLNGDRSDVEFSSNVLVAETVFEELENREFSRV